LDATLLAELLGRVELRELLDPEVVAATGRQLQHLSADRMARDAEAVADLLRLLGPLTTEEVAARAGGADAVSLINTINSIIGVDPRTLTMMPAVGGKGSHGGYCGPAVKPIALHMLAELGRSPQLAGLPISGIGGIASWRDAFEYLALGATNVQVCTAAMIFGFRIVQELIDGLADYMDEMGFATTAEFQGRALATVTDWQTLDLNAISKAVIDPETCIGCGRCHIVCEDTSHQAISAARDGRRHFEVREADCVGCNLCVAVCPVPDCLTLRRLAPGEIDARTGSVVAAGPADWTMHPNNPLRQPAAATKPA
jgi:dihydropyrimidine dehydrogenase (NAD+) subunit PreA